jgi:hypothetical protein
VVSLSPLLHTRSVEEGTLTRLEDKLGKVHDRVEPAVLGATVHKVSGCKIWLW